MLMLIKIFIVILSSILFGFILDIIFGDPRWFPHPVKAIGYLALKFELFFRNHIRNEKTAGIFFTISIISVAFLLPVSIIFILMLINIYAAGAVAAILIYTSISIKDLKIESMKVYYELKNNNIENARKNLSMIVGRDTKNLNEREIIRATVETISENLVDGIMSPIFFSFIGWAPLAISFKAVNTLDSMVGYKNKKYRYFGTASAKTDDFMNFIPARISLLIIPAAAAMCKKDWKNSYKIAVRDWRKSPSINSGIPESAFAGALGVKLGGNNYYNGIISMKPEIGDTIRPLDKEDIVLALKLVYASSLIFLFFCILIFSLIFLSLYFIAKRL